MPNDYFQVEREVPSVEDIPCSKHIWYPENIPLSLGPNGGSAAARPGARYGITHTDPCSLGLSRPGSAMADRRIPHRGFQGEGYILETKKNISFLIVVLGCEWAIFGVWLGSIDQKIAETLWWQ